MKETLLDKLENKLKDGIVIFHYRKKNGEIRYAAGTLDATIIPNSTTSNASPTKGSNFSYYDLLASGWRSFNVNELIQIQASVKKM